MTNQKNSPPSSRSESNAPIGISLSREAIGYGIIAVVGIFLRLWQLGKPFLTPAEAHEALAAWRILQPVAEFTPPEPISGLLQSILYVVFSVLGSGEWQARIIPALAGCALIFLPLLYREQLGRFATFLACALLALSPTFWASSRMVDGTTLGWAAAFAAGMGLQYFSKTQNRASLWLAAAAAGIGLTTARSFIPAALLLTGIALLPRWREWRGWSSWISLAHPWGWIIGLGAFLFAATGFFLHPTGLGDSGNGVANLLGGLLPQTGGNRWDYVLQILFLYEPLALLGGLAGGAFFSLHLSRPSSRFAIPVFLLAVVDICLNILYFGKSATDSLLIVLPLTLLLAMMVQEIFFAQNEMQQEDIPIFLLQVVILGTILAAGSLFWVLFLDKAKAVPIEKVLGDANLLSYLYILALSTVMVPVTIGLFWTGWKTSLAARSSVLAFGILLGVLTLAAGLRLNLPASDTMLAELWHSQQSAPAIAVLPDVIHKASLQSVGNETEISMVAVADPNSWLGWELRSYPNVEWRQSPPSEIPSTVDLLLLSPGVPSPVAESWFGTSIGLEHLVQWNFDTFAVYPRYWIYREMPFQVVNYSLWVRPQVALSQQ